MRVVAPILLAAVGLGCATSKPTFVWADEYSDPITADGRHYVIEPGDTIWVRVFNQENMSTKGRVRSDGMVAVPFLNDVQASGYTPDALAAQLQSRLKDYINAPQVTVSVEELHSITVAVLGEVAHPGQVTTASGAGVLQVLAASGGLTEFGHHNRIYVLRLAPERTTRIRFDLDELYRGEGKASSFRMRPGDVLVVE
ncbi:MAG: polysaccharide biosynthesis/export family protein [Deltaproteobacteria bacterium]|nr:polysaccharide biosynthesis/export family protein [Deltaproteobacteria bacterium]